MTTFIALMLLYRSIYSSLKARRNHAQQDKIRVERKQFGGRGCAH
jgi:hypothetical protein